MEVFEELRRRNPNAVAMDGLYLFVTAFFTHLFTRGPWPAVIAAAPLAALLYLGWRASRPFFVVQAATAAVVAVASVMGVWAL